MTIGENEGHSIAKEVISVAENGSYRTSQFLHRKGVLEMSKWMVLLGAFVLVLGLSAAYAQVEVPNFFASEITAGHPITIDGDLSDWAWVDPATIITSDDLEDVLAGAPMQPKDDWDTAIYVGWTRSENMLYTGIQVIDDIFNNDSPEASGMYLDDCVEIVLDGDHSGGSFREEGEEGVQAQQFGIHIPSVAGMTLFYHWAPDDQQWSTEPPWTEVAIGDGELPNVTYEWKMAVWDRHDPGGPGKSTRHILRPDEVIGYQIQIDDVDENPEVADVQPGTGGFASSDSWTDATNISTFTLMPGEEVAVGASSWGAIKALWR